MGWGTSFLLSCKISVFRHATFFTLSDDIKDEVIKHNRDGAVFFFTEFFFFRN